MNTKCLVLLTALSFSQICANTKSDSKDGDITRTRQAVELVIPQLEEKKDSPALKLTKQTLKIAIAVAIFQMTSSENVKGALDSLKSSGENYPEILKPILNQGLNWGRSFEKSLDDIVLGKIIKAGTAVGAYMLTDTCLKDWTEALHLPFHLLNSARILATSGFLYVAVKYYHELGAFKVIENLFPVKEDIEETLAGEELPAERNPENVNLATEIPSPETLDPELK